MNMKQINICFVNINDISYPKMKNYLFKLLLECSFIINLYVKSISIFLISIVKQKIIMIEKIYRARYAVMIQVSFVILKK